MLIYLELRDTYISHAIDFLNPNQLNGQMVEMGSSKGNLRDGYKKKKK